jgi:hypothetical protein
MVRHAQRARGERKPVGRMKGWRNQINRSRAIKNQKPDHGGFFLAPMFSQIFGALMRAVNNKSVKSAKSVVSSRIIGK